MLRLKKQQSLPRSRGLDSSVTQVAAAQVARRQVNVTQNSVNHANHSEHAVDNVTASASSNTPEIPSPTPHSATPTPPSPLKITAYPPRHKKPHHRCKPIARAPAPKSASHRSAESRRLHPASSAPGNRKSPAATHTAP